MKNDSEKMYLTSQQLFEEGKIEQSIKILENIIEKDPSYLLAYCALGRACIDRPDYQKAERILLQVINLNTKWHLPHLYLGWAYEKQQKFEQALVSYQQAVSLKADDFLSRAYLGYMYQHLGDPEAGLKELKVAYQLNQQDVTLIHNMANGLYKLDQSTQAIELLDQALEILETDNQHLARLYNLRGSIFLDLGQLDRSLADIQKAVTLDPTVARFYNNLGDVYFEKGQYEEAINSYNQAIGSDAEKGSALKGIGRSHLRLENWNTAVDFLEKAREAGETVFFGLGIAYFELGDDERGIENLRNEILNEGSAKIEASYYLGFAYAAVEDRDSSVGAFEQFLELSANKANDPEWQEWQAEAARQIEQQV